MYDVVFGDTQVAHRLLAALLAVIGGLLFGLLGILRVIIGALGKLCIELRFLLPGLYLLEQSVQLSLFELALLGAYSEERRLKDIHVTLLDEFGKELQEEGYHKEADVHTIHIGIGSHDDLVVPEAIQSVLNVERRLQEVELLVLIHHLLGHSIAVERLSPEAEHRLCIHVAALGNAAAGRIALGYEDARFLLAVALCIVEVYAAITQLAVVQVGFLAHLARFLGHTSHCLALTLALRHLLQDDFGHIRILVQEVIYLALHEVAYEFVDGDAAVGFCGERTQLDFGLAFEERLLNVDADGRHHAVADVAVVVVLATVLLDDLCDVLLEGSLVCAAQRSVLAVDEGVVFLAVLIAMGEGYLDILALEMHYVIERGGRHAVGQKVAQSVAREDAPAVEHDCQAGVEVGVVAQHLLYELPSERVMLEERRVGFEVDVGSCLVVSRLGDVGDELSALEGGASHLSVSVGACFEMAA